MEISHCFTFKVPLRDIIIINIYKNTFNPLKPSDNLLAEHNGSCSQGQFKFIIYQEINIQYILVVTTYRPYTMGTFSIFVSGLELQN